MPNRRHQPISAHPPTRAARSILAQWRGIDLTEQYAATGQDQLDVGGVGFDPILRVGIFPENAIAIAIAIILATVVAGLYPAWRAGRVDPVESINLV